MYVIMVYDVGVERLARVLKISRRYLNWVQNSVFEGEITASNLKRLREELKGAIDAENDSIIFYILKTGRCVRKETLGVVKGETSILL